MLLDLLFQGVVNIPRLEFQHSLLRIPGELNQKIGKKQFESNVIVLLAHPVLGQHAEKQLLQFLYAGEHVEAAHRGFRLVEDGEKSAAVLQLRQILPDELRQEQDVADIQRGSENSIGRFKARMSQNHRSGLNRITPAVDQILPLSMKKIDDLVEFAHMVLIRREIARAVAMPPDGERKLPL